MHRLAESTPSNASRTILSGRADEIVELAKTNLRDLGVE
jgi:hypothetical protein